LVRLENGESVHDAWQAIWNERTQTQAPTGVLDVIELGEGEFPLTDQNGNPVLHSGSSSSDPVAPPLLIRGQGGSNSGIRCSGASGGSACVVSRFGLILEDLCLRVAQDDPTPVLRTELVDLTLRRVKLLGEIFPSGAYSGALEVFRGELGLEDSIVVGKWRMPEPLGLPGRCSDFPAGSSDGVYTVFDHDGVGREVYCDMSGGGWMLVGKIYRSHAGASGIWEPSDWWTAGTGQSQALVPGTVDFTTGTDYASYGSAWLADLELSVARFDLIAEDATAFERIEDAVAGETATWYKDPSTIATWFSTSDFVASTVCETEALDCGVTGRILLTNDATRLEGMILPMGSGTVHIRPDVDKRPEFDGVCSYTYNDSGWADDAAEHWGNGLDIWVK
jgi:hypothetical protein